jgi:Raf kinase inhibitor-like YbhB/YbcL family protein
MSNEIVTRRLLLARSARIALGAAAASALTKPALAKITFESLQFVLTSEAFKEGGTIPQEYSCEGANVSPPLSWSGAPGTTLSYALVCYDPDAPGRTFHHWGIYDLAVSRTGLKQGFPRGAEIEGARQAVNDAGTDGYFGPCPPPGGAHHYHFDLFALPVAKLDVPPRPSCDAVRTAAKAKALATASLIGLFSR